MREPYGWPEILGYVLGVIAYVVLCPIIFVRRVIMREPFGPWPEFIGGVLGILASVVLFPFVVLAVVAVCQLPGGWVLACAWTAWLMFGGRRT